LLAVKSGFILFIKNYQFPLQINTLEREREREENATPAGPPGATERKQKGRKTKTAYKDEIWQ
jgi:hypothetical protein